MAEYELERDFALRSDKDGQVFLEDKRDLFDRMMIVGIEPNEHIPQQKFWADTKRLLAEYEDEINLILESEEHVCRDCTA